MTNASKSMMRSLDIKRYKYYDILEVEPKATRDDIRKAYRRKALIYHPDKGGKKDQWLELLKAYETLIDPIKRDLYNRFGENGFKLPYCPNAHSHTQAQEPIINLPKMKSISFGIEISLEDCYFGRKMAFEIKRNRTCALCNGKGASNGNILNCIKCNGVGYLRLHTNYSQESMLSLNNYIKCDECFGEGYFYKDKCTLCNGKKVAMVKSKIEISIERGTNDGDKYIILNEGQGYPGFNTGDVVIVFKLKPHSAFIRQGRDLLMNLTISLEKSLLGFDIPIGLIDNSRIRIKNNPGDVIQPRMIKTVIGKGMPIKNKPNQFGNLNIKFDVEFPTRIEISTLRQLRSWFNHKPIVNKSYQTFIKGNNNNNSNTNTNINKSNNNETKANNKDRNKTFIFNMTYKKKCLFRKQILPIVILTDNNQINASSHLKHS